jgi:hypothetical protein
LTISEALYAAAGNGKIRRKGWVRWLERGREWRGKDCLILHASDTWITHVWQPNAWDLMADDWLVIKDAPMAAAETTKEEG